MQIVIKDLGPNDAYVELTQEENANDGATWVRIKVGYASNPPVLNTGVGIEEALALAHALNAIAP